MAAAKSTRQLAAPRPAQEDSPRMAGRTVRSTRPPVCNQSRRTQTRVCEVLRLAQPLSRIYVTGEYLKRHEEPQRNDNRSTGDFVPPPRGSAPMVGRRWTWAEPERCSSLAKLTQRHRWVPGPPRYFHAFPPGTRWFRRDPSVPALPERNRILLPGFAILAPWRERFGMNGGASRHNRFWNDSRTKRFPRSSPGARCTA